MEKKLKSLFAYQEFIKEPELEGILMDAVINSGEALSEEELGFVYGGNQNCHPTSASFTKLMLVKPEIEVRQAYVNIKSCISVEEKLKIREAFAERYGSELDD